MGFSAFMNNQNSGSFFSNIGVGEYDRIKKTAKKYNIDKYSIDKDGRLIVYGDVIFDDKIKMLPLRFKKVTGDFICQSPFLTSLEGAPETVEHDFIIDGSKNLKSLEHGPKIVFGIYSISNCTNLKSINGIAKKIGVSLYAENIGIKLSIKDINKYTTIRHNNIHI